MIQCGDVHARRFWRHLAVVEDGDVGFGLEPAAMLRRS
jgi:hypothetical protein